MVPTNPTWLVTRTNRSSVLWTRRLPDGRDMCAQNGWRGKILTPYASWIANKSLQSWTVSALRVPWWNSWVVWDIPWKPVDLLRSWQQKYQKILQQNHYLNSVIAVRGTVPGFGEDHATIVHGDLRHSSGLRQGWTCLSSGCGDSVRLTDRMFTTWRICYGLISGLWKFESHGYKYNQVVLDK